MARMKSSDIKRTGKPAKAKKAVGYKYDATVIQQGGNLIIFDVSALMRASYNPRWHMMVDGHDVSALYGIFRRIIKYGFNNDYIFCYDTPKNLLKRINSSYKAGRVKMGNGYYAQVNQSLASLRDAGFKVLAREGYEADHCIHKAVHDNYANYDRIFVLTNDVDLSCLIDEKVTWINVLDKRRDIDLEHYVEYVKCPYNSILLKKCLVGDKSDNIAGVKRFGEKAYERFCEDNDIADIGANVRGNEPDIIKNSNLTDVQKEQALAALLLVLPVKMDDLNALAVPRQEVNLREFFRVLAMFDMNKLLERCRDKCEEVDYEI